MKVFLGGTCNDSTWRSYCSTLLDAYGIEYFNPVVPDWTEECYQEELKQREICDLVLYVITPQMTGVYSIAEVVDDSNKRPEKTIFMYCGDNGMHFTKGQEQSLEAVGKMVANNGAAWVANWQSLEYWMKEVQEA